MRNKKIVIPVLNDEWEVVVCWGSESFIKKVLVNYGHNLESFSNWQKPFEFGEIYRGHAYKTQGCKPVIYIKGYPKTPEEFGTLAHESCHAMTDIFDALGVNISDSEEIFCMCVGAIVRGVLKK